MPQVTISPETAPDPNAKPQDNISGDGNKVVVDPNKSAGDKPADKLILGKYKTQADLEQAYVELEKKLGTTDATNKAVPTADEARKAVADAGLDMAAISQEYSENNGKLSDKTMKALAAKGITSEHVNVYIGGLKAQATQMRQEFAQVAGGEEILKGVLEWAATNGDPEAVQAYNQAVESGNVVVAKLALQALGASYNEAVGSDPALLNGDSGSDSGGVQPYSSAAQVQAAMSDPRYQTDEAYRQEVYKHMAKTNLFNIKSGR